MNQLNRGAALMTSPEERERVAELDLAAGERAKGSAAYASALSFLAAGSALLPDDVWDRRYPLVFAIELRRAECEYLVGELMAAEVRLARLSCRAKSIVDSAAVTCARVALYTILGRTEQSIEACLEFLRRVGFHWSPCPTHGEVQREFDRMWQLLSSRAIEDLIDLPLVGDPDCRATMDVLTETFPAASFAGANLHALAVVRMVNLGLEHGNGDGSCLAYVWLGALLGSRFGDYRTAHRFGKLGLDLVEKHGLIGCRARVQYALGNLVVPWCRPLGVGLELLRRGVETAQETGEVLFESYSRDCILAILYAMGDSLAHLQHEAETVLECVRKAKYGAVADNVIVRLQLVRFLRGLLPDFSSSFDDTHFDEGRFQQQLESGSHLALVACWYWIRKLQAAFHAGDYASATESATRAGRLLWASDSFFEIAEYHFYGALARAARHDAAHAHERPSLVAALGVHRVQLEAWAESCPETFRNRAALVAAEIARLEGRDLDAMHLYEEAVQSAHENGFVQNEAVAYELASRFYRARGFDEFADHCLRGARACYARWGADGKVRQLDKQHPHLIERRAFSSAATVAVGSDQLDLSSVTKASQTISGEIELEELVRTLLRIVLEQGGAERACLLLCQGALLAIEAEAILDQKGAATSLLGAVPVDASQRVPASLVHYVQRTKDSVILSNATVDAGKFANDGYFARTKPRSILCMPILRQAQVVGLLYLENNLLVGAFTPERLAALELLATQVAISLDNARLLGWERAARAAAEAAERRAAFLAEAGSVLSESLEYEVTFTRLGELCVQRLADWCSIDIVEGREIRRLAGAHRDPDKAPIFEELRRRYSARWGAPHPSVMVIRTGEPRLMPELPDEILRTMCVDDEHFRLLRALGTTTGLAVPLVARGQVLGALTLSSAAPGRRFERADLELAEEVARRAAIAIDNARLYRASQEAVRVRNQFLTVASHELNTPLTSLLVTLQSLRRAVPAGTLPDPHELDRRLELAARQGRRLAKLVHDLLDVSRIEAGALPLELSTVDLGALVREVVARFELDLTRSRCSISIDARAPILGQWDRSGIDRIITNLLSNAIKFGPGKPIEISIGAERGILHLAVRDQGMGIDPEQCDRIFGRFERAVSERHYGGLGLGLYISRKIAEEHGGSIRCESKPGVGSTFTVELPCAGPGSGRRFPPADGAPGGE